MGIDNINRAKCDNCKKTVYSQKKQVIFLTELRELGWKGTINNLLCPDCSKGGVTQERKAYIGKIKEVVRVGEKYYVKVINPNITVMIPYTELLSLPIEGEPTFGYLCRKLRSRGEDPNAVKYKDTKRVTVAGRDFLVAKYIRQ